MAVKFDPILGKLREKDVTDGGSATWGNIDGTLSDQTDLQTALDAKVDENAAIVAATKTKITYDTKGLVTAGANATTADIAASTDKNYVTDAQLVVIGNTSGTNTGDQTIPVKATGAEIDTGLNDTKFATPKAIADSGIAFTSDIPVIGVDVQAYSANLDEYAGVNPTAAGLALLDDANAAAQLATLGLTATAAEINILDGATLDVTELNYVDGVTSAIQTQLDAKQPLDSDLTTIAGLTATTDNFLVSVSSAWASRTPTQVRTTLGLVIGTNVQAWSANLDEYSAVNPTAAGLALLDDADADAQLITLGLTATASELNILDGATLTVTELNYVDGVTSAIQTQLDAKQPLDADLTTLATAFATASASGPASLALHEDTDNGTNKVTLIAPASIASDKTITFQDVTGTVYVSGGTDVAVADGGTGASDASGARTALGLVIGTNVLAYDAQVQQIADLADPDADRILFWDDSASAYTHLAPGNSVAITTTTLDTIQDIRTSATPTFAGLTINGPAVFNEGSADADFRIESNDLTHIIFVDASANRIGINEDAPAGFFHLNAGAERALVEVNNAAALSPLNLWNSDTGADSGAGMLFSAGADPTAGGSFIGGVLSRRNSATSSFTVIRASANGSVSSALVTGGIALKGTTEGGAARFATLLNTRFVSIPAAAQDISGNGQTITLPTASFTKEITAGAARTGTIIEAGVEDGQIITLFNSSAAANTVTMATAATSNVANGTACVLRGLEAIMLQWDSGSSRWYQIAGL